MSTFETRQEAWDSMQGLTLSLREKILRLIEAHPMTGDEVEVVTGLRHQTASARIYELKGGSERNPVPPRIFDSGERRKTRSGRRAIVWTAEKPDDGQMDLWE